MKKWALAFGNTLNPGGQDHLGSMYFHIHFLYLTYRQGYYRAKPQHCQSIPTSTFVEQTQGPVRMHRPKAGLGWQPQQVADQEDK